MGRVPALVALAACLVGPVGARAQTAPVPARPGIAGNVVFLYYPDLARAKHFYGTILGFTPLKRLAHLDWVTVYAVTDSVHIGIVDEKKGSLRSSSDKPVMVSWITDDVDGWYAYLKSKGVEIPKPPTTVEETGIRAFLFTDPGGYTLECFQWVRPEGRPPASRNAP